MSLPPRSRPTCATAMSARLDRACMERTGGVARAAPPTPIDDLGAVPVRGQ